MSEKELEDPVYKLKVLKAALVNEKSKSEGYINQIESLKIRSHELDTILEERESKLIKSMDEKNSIESEFINYKSKFKKADNVTEIFSHCIFKDKEIYDLKSKEKELLDNIENFTQEFQFIVLTQQKKIQELEKEHSHKSKELEDYLKSNELIIESSKRNSHNVSNLENTLREREDEIKKSKLELEDIKKILDQKDREIEELMDSLRRKEDENTQLNKKFAEIKNSLIQENMDSRIFKGKITSKIMKPAFEIKFEKNKENFYVGVFSHEDKEVSIKIEDIEMFKLDENSQNQIEFGFYMHSKLKKYTLSFNEGAAEAFEIYKESLTKSIKESENLYY